MDSSAHLRLAGVTRLSIHGRGPKDGFVFDPHRLALPCWTLAVGDGPAATLLTFDRHLDLVTPARAIPRRPPLRELDELTRWQLDVRNVDHIAAAMDAGIISDVVAIARARPSGTLMNGSWRDSHGAVHAVDVAPTLAAFLESSDAPRRDALARLRSAERIILDFDLDCFTTPSDADPTDVIPWPERLIRDHLLPAGSNAFWDDVLARCIALTFAREPAHCGGLVAAGDLFASASRVIFEQLLRADLP